jgi:hypothetical protein
LRESDFFASTLLGAKKMFKCGSITDGSDITDALRRSCPIENPTPPSTWIKSGRGSCSEYEKSEGW